MYLKKLRNVEALANNLKRTIPASHSDAFTVHQSPAKVSEAIDAAFELSKMEAVVEYIESQPDDQRDARTLAKLSGPMSLFKHRVEAADALETQLTEIAVNFQIEKVARDAGAINPDLVGTYINHISKLTNLVDSEGNVTILADGRPIKDVAKSMAANPDTQHLFDCSKAKDESGNANTTAVENPWVKATFNLTTQGKIYRQNPELAARLKAAAEAMQS